MRVCLYPSNFFIDRFDFFLFCAFRSFNRPIAASLWLVIASNYERNVYTSLNVYRFSLMTQIATCPSFSPSYNVRAHSIQTQCAGCVSTTFFGRRRMTISEINLFSADARKRASKTTRAYMYSVRTNNDRVRTNKSGETVGPSLRCRGPPSCIIHFSFFVLALPFNEYIYICKIYTTSVLF